MASSDVTVPRQQPVPDGPEGDEGDVTVMACLKGGSTKTTTTNYLAFVRALRRKRKTGQGRPVKVLDADTVSQTTFRWAKKFKDEQAEKGTKLEYPLDVERYPFEDLDDYIAELQADGYDVFADIGGGNVALFHKALKHANRLIVPLSPSGLDVDRVAPTFTEAAKIYGDNSHGGFETYVLLSRKISDKQSREARGELAPLVFLGKPVRVLDTEVEQLIEYTRQLGKVPTNLDEYTDVWDEMMRSEARKRAGLTEVYG
ncbi:division plane positioning ATPase MipZ [Streptomyces diastaticus]|uniref:division plane positioning ATPase MipZ n=1 Tax=Streptomyces diastaticus TaxID=1956 RepID=UPI003D17EB31